MSIQNLFYPIISNPIDIVDPVDVDVLTLPPTGKVSNAWYRLYKVTSVILLVLN